MRSATDSIHSTASGRHHLEAALRLSAWLPIWLPGIGARRRARRRMEASYRPPRGQVGGVHDHGAQVELVRTHNSVRSDVCPHVLDKNITKY